MKVLVLMSAFFLSACGKAPSNPAPVIVQQITTAPATSLACRAVSLCNSRCPTLAQRKFGGQTAYSAEFIQNWIENCKNTMVDPENAETWPN